MQKFIGGPVNGKEYNLPQEVIDKGSYIFPIQYMNEKPSGEKTHIETKKFLYKREDTTNTWQYIEETR